MSDSRAIAAFTGVGVVLVGVAVGLSRLMPAPNPVSLLPSVTTATAVALPGTPAVAGSSSSVAPKLLQHPTLSRSQIAFDYAGEIWVVARDGGEARRLVTGQLRNSRPVFSPDGSQVAFTGMYDGNADVYVVAAGGGEPKRLTYHPGVDSPVGWTPDGSKVLFRSWRDTARDLDRLFTVAVTGGLPEPLPLPSADDASYSPDAARLAYIPYFQWEPGWKKYRGGQTTPIWIADLSSSQVVPVPRTDSNDRNPMWVGDTVYFVSDRSGPYTLFAYDTKSKDVRELVHNPDGFGVRSASAGPGAIVYEQLDGLHLYDLASGATRAVPVTLSADLPQLRPRFQHIHPDQVLSVALSPTGKRALFESHGEILSVPVDKGDVRNLTQSPGVADRDPAWSPDGKWIAWLSDESGEYALYLRSPDGLGPIKKIDLGDPPSFFYEPRWSPDSKKVLLRDKRHNLWLIDLEHPTLLKVDTQRFADDSFDASWAPDSRWIAYQKELDNHLRGTFVYSLTDHKARQVTDGASDTSSARFDRSGKYLWFLAATDVGLRRNNGMTAMGRPVTSSVYGIVLQKDKPSPVAPESDEEGDAGPGGIQGAPGKEVKKEAKGVKDDKSEKDKAGKSVEPVTIDFDGLDQRIVALPIDRASYGDIEAGADGVLFLLRTTPALADEDYVERDEHAPIDVLRFDTKKRKAETFVDKIDDARWGTFIVSQDRKKVLYAKDKKWFLVGADEAPKEGDGLMKSAGDMEVWVDPRAEWRQMYHEVWRIERDFLYDPHAAFRLWPDWTVRGQVEGRPGQARRGAGGEPAKRSPKSPASLPSERSPSFCTSLAGHAPPHPTLSPSTSAPWHTRCSSHAVMHAIAFHTKRAFHGFLRFTRKPLAARGLTAARFDLLYVIEQSRAADSAHMGVWQYELRRKLGVCPSVISRMLQSLLDLGLISRRRSDADRRSWIITLTPEGIAAVDRAKRWLFREVRRAVHVAICFGKHRSPEARFWAMANLESYLDGLRRQFRDFATLCYPWGHPDD